MELVFRLKSVYNVLTISGDIISINKNFYVNNISTQKKKKRKISWLSQKIKECWRKECTKKQEKERKEEDIYIKSH